jgi:hypothetical protein
MTIVAAQFSFCAASATPCSSPRNNKYGYDSGGKKNECILGGCLAVVVVLLPKKVLNKTLHIEIAIRNHGASIV